MARRLMPLLLVLVALAGCVNETARRTSRSSSASSSPQVRCLNNPNESDHNRPLFFLFCMQSP